MSTRPTPRAAPAGSPPHPDIGILIDYHHRRLARDAAAAVERHLARCRHCAALRHDLESFSLAEADPLPPQEQAAARLLTRSVLQQLRAERWRNRALAASLLLAMILPVGLYYGVQAARPGAGLSPQVNQPILALNPRSSLRGSEEDRVPPGNQFFTLVLSNVDTQAFPEYSLAIVDRTGHQVLALSGLDRTRLGTFNLGLPTSAFKPGRYRLLLFGVAGARREPVEEYTLEIAPP